MIFIKVVCGVLIWERKKKRNRQRNVKNGNICDRNVQEPSCKA